MRPTYLLIFLLCIVFLKTYFHARSAKLSERKRHGVALLLPAQVLLLLLALILATLFLFSAAAWVAAIIAAASAVAAAMSATAAAAAGEFHSRFRAATDTHMTFKLC